MYSCDEQEAKPVGKCWVLYVTKLRAHSFNPGGTPMIGRAPTTQGSRSIRLAAEKRAEYSLLAFAPCGARKRAGKAHAIIAALATGISSAATWRTASARPIPDQQ